MSSYDDDDGVWDFLNSSIIGDHVAPGFSWFENMEFDLSNGEVSVPGVSNCPKSECPCKRRRYTDSQNRAESKAFREKLRRGKLNDRFFNLSSVLDSKKPARTEKLVVLNDAIKVLKQLKNEVKQLEVENEKLQIGIKKYKAEKKELRSEKVKVEVEKEKMAQRMKATPWTTTPSFVQPKLPLLPTYRLVPFWHYIPPSVVDSPDQLRPPAAA